MKIYFDYFYSKDYRLNSAVVGWSGSFTYCRFLRKATLTDHFVRMSVQPSVIEFADELASEHTLRFEVE